MVLTGIAPDCGIHTHDVARGTFSCVDRGRTLIHPARHRRRNMKALSRMLLAGIAATLALGTAQGAPKKIAISMIVEVPQLVETKNGVLKGLAEKGLVEGKDFVVEYQTANGSMPTQQQIAKKF